LVERLGGVVGELVERGEEVGVWQAEVQVLDEVTVHEELGQAEACT
jgi:hypothetical protein